MKLPKQTSFKSTAFPGNRWQDIRDKSGLVLLNLLPQMLLDLGKTQDPLIAAIYADAQTRLREPRHLEQLIKSIDGIDWFSAEKDGLGDLYEGLLEKNVSETKSGAGQYFIESDREAAPFSRAQRSLVYQRAKGEPDNRPFGTQLDVGVQGVRVDQPFHGPYQAGVPRLPYLGGRLAGSNRRHRRPLAPNPYSMSVFNISAMSFWPRCRPTRYWR